MAQLTTGIVENTAVSGVRPTSTLAVRITNDGLAVGSIGIKGFYVDGAVKVQYVEELFLVAAGAVATKNYYAQFDALEFQFTTSDATIQTTAWGKDAAGNLTTAHRVLAQELNLV